MEDSWLFFSIVHFFLLIFSSSFFALGAFALDAIVRPYQSVRSVGMGGVRMSTGLYEENFFNNPARVNANPYSKFTLISAMPLDISKSTVQDLKNLKNKNYLNVLENAKINNIYYRFQIALPSYYLASNEEREWAMALGFIASFQLDAALRKSYNLNVDSILDIGPALTYGRKFLKDDNLALGITAHLISRFGADPSYGLIDYLRGTQLTITSLEGSGAMLDFDLGGTYDLSKIFNFDVSLAIAIQNILGGNYSNILFDVFKNQIRPPSQPRSLGLGIAGTRSSFGLFGKTTIAFEITDIGNNINGSFYRLLHFGGEVYLLSTFSVRGGINQGYMTAGVGLDLKYINIDLSTYGEELSLNAGNFEDRRYGININLSI